MLKFEGGPESGRKDSTLAQGATLIAKWNGIGYTMYTTDGLPLDPDGNGESSGTPSKDPSDS